MIDNEPAQPEVVAVGFEPAPLRGHEDAPPVVAGGEATADLLAALTGPAAAPVLAVVPASAGPEVRRRIEVLRSSLAGRRDVIALETRLPPLGAAVLAGLAGSLAPLAPSPGVLTEALHLLEADLVVAAAVPGVLRLRRPKPPLGARARSLLPGARYVVRAQPGPLVAPASAPPDLLDGDPAGLAVLLAGSDERLEAALAAAFPGAPVDAVGPRAGAGRHWGAKAVVEAVAYPADRHALAADVLSLPAAACPWCGEAVASVPCPLCGHDRNPALVEAA